MSIPESHRSTSPASLRVAVITVSDTRSTADDLGGALVCDLLAGAGHVVTDRLIVRDDPAEVRTALAPLCVEGGPDAVLLTGGTGLSPRDQTFEAVDPLLTKRIPGYGELFRWLSFQQVGPAAMLSRAHGGLVGRTVVLTMPGSPAGVRLAMERLVLPELAHLVGQARR